MSSLRHGQSETFWASDVEEPRYAGGPRSRIKQALAGSTYEDQLELVKPGGHRLVGAVPEERSTSNATAVQKVDAPDAGGELREPTRLAISVPDLRQAGRPVVEIEIDLADAGADQAIEALFEMLSGIVDHMTGHVQIVSGEQFSELIVCRVGLEAAANDLLGDDRSSGVLGGAVSAVTRARAFRSFRIWSTQLARTLDTVGQYQSTVEQMVAAEGILTIRDVLEPAIAERELAVEGTAGALSADRELLIDYLADVIAYLEELEFGTEGHVRELRSHLSMLTSLRVETFLTQGDVRAYLNARRYALRAVDAIADEPFSQRNRTGCSTRAAGDNGGLSRESRMLLNTSIGDGIQHAVNEFGFAVEDVVRLREDGRDMESTIVKSILDIASELIIPRIGDAVVNVIGQLGLANDSVIDIARITQPHARSIVKELADRGRSAAHDYIDSIDDWEDGEKRWTDMKDAFEHKQQAIRLYVLSNVLNDCALPDEEMLIYRANSEYLRREDYAAQILATLDRYDEQVRVIPDTGHNLPWAYWIDLSQYGMRPRLALLNVDFAHHSRRFVRWVDRDMEDHALARMASIGREVETVLPRGVSSIDPLPPTEQSYADGRWQ